MKNRRMYIVIKHMVYCLLVCLSYILSSSPHMSGIRPVLLLPAVVVIAQHEKEFAGGIYGALAGLLMDYGAATIFGINTMLTLIMGCAAGLISLYYLQNSLRSALILTSLVSLIHGSANYFLLYGMWRLPGSGHLFLTVFLPTAFFSVLYTPVYRFLIGKVYGHFEPLCRSVEEV